MIYIFLTFFVLLFFCGFFWLVLRQPIEGVLDKLVLDFPGYYDPVHVTFVRAILYWVPFLVLIGGIIWVIVSSQRTTPGGYYS